MQKKHCGSILRALFQGRNFLLGEFPMPQFPKLYQTSLYMTISRNVSKGWESKDNPRCFLSTLESLSLPDQLLVSNSTGQCLGSITDQKFIAKQTFRTWGKVENHWPKNYSEKKRKKTVEDLPSVLFSIQVLLGSEQAFVPWKFTSSLKKIPCCHGNSIPSWWILLEGGGHWQE